MCVIMIITYHIYYKYSSKATVDINDYEHMNMLFIFNNMAHLIPEIK